MPNGAEEKPHRGKRARNYIDRQHLSSTIFPCLLHMATSMFFMILAALLRAVLACICTPSLFSRLPMNLCHDLVDPFCAAMDEAHANGLNNGSLVVDVGAAYGIEATIARQRGHSVISFECRHDEFRRLRAQFRNDALVAVEHACVSDRVGSATLLRAGHSSSLLASSLSGSQEMKLANAERQHQEEVRLVVLDEFLSTVKQRLGVLKIDVQGYEPAVLRGARKTILNDQPFIFYEETFHKNDAQRMDGRLLWDVLGTNLTYGCQCASDCFCWPRRPADLVASSTAPTSPQSRACHSGMRFQQSSTCEPVQPRLVSPFAVNASACEQTLERCPIGAGVGPRNKTTAASHSRARHRVNYYFMGNSVDRHYAFALHNLLRGRVGSHVNRSTEKGACQGVLGTSSCRLRTDLGKDITFLWKNYVGLEAAHDDADRDACSLASETTLSCLSRLFASASRDDVLIMGSTPCNTSLFHSMGGNSKASMEVSAPVHAAAAAHADHGAILRMLLSAFPGRIVWHSFAWVRMDLHTGAKPFDINWCMEAIDEQIRCAARAHQERVRFVNLRPLQMRHAAEYKDFIHHPGPLSMKVLRQVLGVLGL